MKHVDRVTRVPQRWSILAAATVATARGLGMMTTVAGFIQPLEREFGWGLFWGHHDVTRAHDASFSGAAVAGGGNLLIVLVIGLASVPTIGTGVIVILAPGRTRSQHPFRAPQQQNESC